MASTFGPRLWRRPRSIAPSARQLGRRMTLHAAAAVMVFAIAQIWLVTSAVAWGVSSLVAGVALVLLVGLAIPVARRLERRWHELSRGALSSHGLHARFRRDVRRLWLAVLMVPMLWVGGALFATQAIAAVVG